MSRLMAKGGAGRGVGPTAALLLQRWLADPLQMGSVVPSSPALCHRVAAPTRRGPGEAVLKLGAGAGVVRRALLGAGVPPERLTVLEIVLDMAEHLHRALPGVEVLCGDAFDLAKVVPGRWQGPTGTAICGIPPALLPIAEQRRFVEAVEAVAPGRGLLLYARCVTPPLPHRKPGLAALREAWTLWNLPPASVWRCWHDDVRTPF